MIVASLENISISKQALELHGYCSVCGLQYLWIGKVLWCSHLATICTCCLFTISNWSIWNGSWVLLLCVCAQLLYNIVLVSVMHHQESATGIHMSPPSWSPLLSPSPSHPLAVTEHWVEFLVQRFLQQLGLGSNLDGHWLTNGYRHCGTYI